MKIEKVNDRTIRCTLTKSDLNERKLKLSELAYGTEKARGFFKDMIQQASYQFGFEAEDIPLMIEAIPLSGEAIVLVITKVEDPDELDTRFSRFAPDLKEYGEFSQDNNGSGLSNYGADDVIDLVKRLHDTIQTANKALKGEIESIKSKAAAASVGNVMDQVREVKGVKLLATEVAGVDMNALRDLSDKLKAELGEGVVVLFSQNDGKVSIVVTATEGAQKQGAHSGNLIKAIAGKVGGGGGGRPNMASAGGKNPAGIPDAIKEAEVALEGMLK